MVSYQTTDYLLDRANIHDTVTKMMLYVDLHLWDKFIAEVPAENVTLDYTSMFGGEPRQTTPQKIVEQWKPLLDTMDATQHLTASVLISLPQPGSSTSVPKKANVIMNGFANLIRKDVKGDPRTTNGGRYDLELERVSEDPNFGNPWRITRIKADVSWYAGNMTVLSGAS